MSFEIRESKPYKFIIFSKLFFLEILFLSNPCTQDGVRTQPQDQESHAVTTEPARHPDLKFSMGLQWPTRMLIVLNTHLTFIYKNVLGTCYVPEIKVDAVFIVLSKPDEILALMVLKKKKKKHTNKH